MSDLQSPQKLSTVLNAAGQFNVFWFNWFLQLFQLVSPMTRAFSGTIATAKLTPTGANGSLTFVNGVVTSSTPAS